MKNTCGSLLIVLVALASCRLAALSAQNRDTTTLAPIVVTATRSPAPTGTLSNSVTVLEGADLVRAGIATVGDAVRALAGVAVTQTGSYGGVTSLFLRGGQSNYVRVLVDGVPINGTGGYLDLANVTTLDVERIELVRGPASVLYGSDAVSGVMQVFTRRPAGARATFTARGGTYGSSDVGAELSTGRPEAGATFALAQSATDGIYDFNNRYRNSTVSGSVRFAPDDRTDMTLAARYGDAVFHYPTNGSGTPNDSTQFATSRRLTTSLDAGRRLSSRVEGRMLLGYNEERTRTEDPQQNAADTTGVYDYHSRGLVRRKTADLRLNVRGNAATTYTVGATVESESERDTFNYRSSFGPSGGPFDTSRTNRALYGQIVTGWGGRAWLQAGARLDDNDKFGTFGTWRLGATALVARATRVRASFGTAFREPSLDQNYSTAFTTGNPDLKPERSASWELGLERAFPLAHGTVSVTYFDQRFRDMIQYAYVSPTAPNYYNIAGANASGVEIEARFLPVEGLRLAGQYSFVHTSVTDSGYDGAQFKPGSPLIRRPAHSASISADFTPFVGLDAGLRVAYTGRREDLDFSQFPAARVSLAPYTRLDLWADVSLMRLAPGRPVLIATGRIDNVWNVAYTEIYGFRTPGRTLRIGVRIEAGR